MLFSMILCQVLIFCAHGNQFCNIFFDKIYIHESFKHNVWQEALGAFFCLYLDIKFNATFRPMFSRLVIDFYLKADKSLL